MEKHIENFLKLFDLPLDNLTPKGIIKTIKDYSNYDVLDQPKIGQIQGLPCCNALVRINDTEEKFLEVAKKMKYFEMNGFQCRSIPLKITDYNSISKKLLIKNLQKNVTQKQLDQKFEEVLGGDYVMTAIIEFNPDQQSKGRGCVILNNEEGAKLALEKAAAGEFDFEVHAQKVQQTSREVQRKFSRTYNVISIKNFPIYWDKEIIEIIFRKYGNIKSTTIIMSTNKKSQSESPFALVCYELPQDINYGPMSALVAIIQENDKEYDGFKLKVKEANYKSVNVRVILSNAKIIRQLDVKNFPENTTEEQIKAYFEKYGEIESFELFQNENVIDYAFVCFKSPESATKAKQQSSLQTFNGNKLSMIYSKSREGNLKQGDNGKTEFVNLRKPHPSCNLEIDMQIRPENLQKLQYLLITILRQQKDHRLQNTEYYNQHRSAQQVHQVSQNQLPPGMNQEYQCPVMRPQDMRNAQIVPGPSKQNLPIQMLKYNQFGKSKLLPLVTISNPNYKIQVGECIYDHVEQLAGEKLTPKIVGMLIDLPITEIQAYVSDFIQLHLRVFEASYLLKQESISRKQE
eukprot:403368457